jgi:hypothetical protein
MILTSKLGNSYYWSDEAVEEVRTAFENSQAAKVLAPPPRQARPGVTLTDPKSTAIFEFMEQHCDFACEHADGSFMDHLFFCRDYRSVFVLARLVPLLVRLAS